MSQKVFQILDDQVIVLAGGKEYHDTVKNFKADSGLADLPEKVIYDDLQRCCVVGDEFQKFPNSTYDAYITKIGDYITAQEKRLYVPPTPAEEFAAAKSAKLGELGELLSRTDYQAIKFAEGEITAKQYAPIKTARAAWREAYNAAEKCGTVEELAAVTYETAIPEVLPRK